MPAPDTTAGCAAEANHSCVLRRGYIDPTRCQREARCCLDDKPGDGCQHTWTGWATTAPDGAWEMTCTRCGARTKSADRAPPAPRPEPSPVAPAGVEAMAGAPVVELPREAVATLYGYFGRLLGADPAPAALAGAMRDAAQAAADAWLMHEHGSDVFPDAMGHLKDALAAEGTAGDGWLPIETAPKTDGEVQLYCADTEQQFVGYRTPAGWQYAFAREGYAIVCAPTHWRPLPAPPSAKGR